jgi:peptidoglycan LD-endopeptidase CwlK
MAESGMIVDSAMDFPEAIAGTAASREVIEALCLIPVRYVGFDGRRHEGQLVVHRELAADLGEIFALMEISKFPVAGAVPIVRYGWSDEASMATDNASAFNYRTVFGTDRLSSHATGRAVDINPRQNPAIYSDGRIAPTGALYRPGSPGTFTDEHPVVCAFRERGWRWGGDFGHMKDYHHFEKQRTEEAMRKGRSY